MYYAPTPPPPHIAGRSSAAASTLRVGVPFANELHQQNAADLRFTRDNLREYVHLCRIGDAQKGLEVILRVSTSWWELLVLVVLVGITGPSSTGSILPGSPLRNSRQEITSTSSSGRKHAFGSPNSEAGELRRRWWLGLLAGLRLAAKWPSEPAAAAARARKRPSSTPSDEPSAGHHRGSSESGWNRLH